MSTLKPLEQLEPARFDTPAILKKLASSRRQLAELKGLAASMPHQGILINTLGLLEAKDSSEIENIVTTHDELFKDDVHPEAFANPAAKEVLRYRQALRFGFEQVQATGLLTANHIVQNQADYYRLLQTMRDDDTWEDWVLYMLQAVETTARQTVNTVQAIKTALFDYKHRIRGGYKFYSQDLINNLFMHPYTKIEFVQRDLQVSRLTATKYLEALVDGGFVNKQKVGRSNYYVNVALNGILLAPQNTAR